MKMNTPHKQIMIPRIYYIIPVREHYQRFLFTPPEASKNGTVCPFGTLRTASSCFRVSKMRTHRQPCRSYFLSGREATLPQKEAPTVVSSCSLVQEYCNHFTKEETPINKQRICTLLLLDCEGDQAGFAFPLSSADLRFQRVRTLMGYYYYLWIHNALFLFKNLTWSLLLLINKMSAKTIICLFGLVAFVDGFCRDYVIFFSRKTCLWYFDDKGQHTHHIENVGVDKDTPSKIVERARDCTEHFGECSIRELEDLQSC